MSTSRVRVDLKATEADCLDFAIHDKVHSIAHSKFHDSFLQFPGEGTYVSDARVSKLIKIDSKILFSKKNYSTSLPRGHRIGIQICDDVKLANASFLISTWLLDVASYIYYQQTETVIGNGRSLFYFENKSVHELTLTIQPIS